MRSLWVGSAFVATLLISSCGSEADPRGAAPLEPVAAETAGAATDCLSDRAEGDEAELDLSRLGTATWIELPSVTDGITVVDELGGQGDTVLVALRTAIDASDGTDRSVDRTFVTEHGFLDQVAAMQATSNRVHARVDGWGSGVDALLPWLVITEDAQGMLRLATTCPDQSALDGELHRVVEAAAASGLTVTVADLVGGLAGFEGYHTDAAQTALALRTAQLAEPPGYDATRPGHPQGTPTP